MEETAQKEESAAFAKSNIPLGYTDFSQRSAEKEDDTHTPPMPPGNEEKKDSVKVCALTVAHTKVDSMCVIPAKVKYKDSNSGCSTFAIFDNCSEGCFVNSSFVKNLRIKGHKTSVSVKTLTGGRMHTSFATDGLKVAELQGWMLSGSISQRLILRLIFQLILAKLAPQRR